MRFRLAGTAFLVSSIFFASLSVAPLASATSGADDSGGERATRLTVKINSADAKPKIKVARDLKVLVSCSNDCRAKARLTLKTPINKLSVGGSQALTSGTVWTTGIRLTRFGLRYLKKTYRKSNLKVAIRARDTATGKIVKKTRYFRFYR